MSTAPSETAVFALVQQYLAAREQGRPVSREELLAAHPELAGPLTRCLDAVDFVAALAPSGPGVGALLGEYRLVAEIGRGGMGVVYEAEQPALGRRVALKVLPLASAQGPEQRRRFENEARAAAGLEHPHVVPVYAVGEAGGAPFIAMRLIDGRPLSELLREDHFPWQAGASRAEAVARLGVQAAEALAYAHRLGVIHRDIKPANLLAEANGHVWVVDFGLARVEGVAALTATDALAGTPRYMSPEQAAGRAIDHRTDQYSLAATLYEALVRRPVAHGETREELLRAVIQGEPVPPGQVDASVPRELETVLLKALAREPAGRYADCQELADDLGRFLRGEPVLARRPGLGAVLGAWAWRRRGLIAAALLALFAGLSVAVVVLLLKNAEVSAAERRERGERIKAEQAEGREREQRVKAQQAERRQREEKSKAVKALAGERRARYLQGVGLAWREWQAGNSDRAGQFLGGCPEELRRWEWHYLGRLFRPWLREWKNCNTPLFSGDGTVLAMQRLGRVELYDVPSFRLRQTVPISPRERLIAVGTRAEGLLLSGPFPLRRYSWLDPGRGMRWPVGEFKRRASEKTFIHGGKLVFLQEGALEVMDDCDVVLRVESVKAAIPSHHPDRLIVQGESGNVYVANAATGRRRLLFRAGKQSLLLAASPEGKQILTGDDLARLWLWSVGEGKRSPKPIDLPALFRQPALGGNALPLLGAAFLSEGRVLVHLRGRLGTLDVRTGQLLGLYGGPISTKRLALSPSRKWLVTDTTTMHLLDVSSAPAEAGLPGRGVHLVFSADGKHVLADHGAGFSLLDATTGEAMGKVAFRRPPPPGVPHAVWFEPDGKAACLLPSGVVTTYTCPGLKPAGGRRLPVAALAPNVRRRLSASGGLYADDGPNGLVVRRQTDGALLWRDPRPSSGSLRFLFLPKKRQAITGKPRDAKLELRDAGTGKLLVARAHDHALSEAAFSEAAGLVAVGLAGGAVEAWSLGDLKTRYRLERGGWLASCIAFSPDGARLAVARAAPQGSEVVLLDAATGDEVLPVALPGKASALAFSPDGRRLVVADDRGRVHVLDGSPR